MDLPKRYMICGVGIFLFGTMVTESDNPWLKGIGLIGASICALVMVVPDMEGSKKTLLVVLGISILILTAATILFFLYI